MRVDTHPLPPTMARTGRGLYGAGMDETQDAPRERTAEQVRSDRDAEEVARVQHQQMVIRRWSWTLAWGIPLVALIVGIALTAKGTGEIWTPVSDGAYDTYDVTMFAVWPAGLVLLAVGALGVTAAAIATALVTTER